VILHLVQTELNLVPVDGVHGVVVAVRDQVVLKWSSYALYVHAGLTVFFQSSEIFSCELSWVTVVNRKKTETFRESYLKSCGEVGKNRSVQFIFLCSAALVLTLIFVISEAKMYCSCKNRF
jgi:hypothetical protein